MCQASTRRHFTKTGLLLLKGVGRSVLESQGWKDGQGMGRKEEGRAHIIDTDGQHPRDKRGLG